MSLMLSPFNNLNRFFSDLFRGLVQFQAQMSFFFAALFISLAAWIVGELIWYSVENESVTNWHAQQNVTTGKGGPSFDATELKQANLFGRFTEKTEPVKRVEVVKDAPKTRLNLILVGVVASSNQAYSLAVISNRGVQATYGINEDIEGTRAKLKAVMVDRVIINNAGRDETVMLQGMDYSKRIVEQDKVSRPPSAARSGNNPAFSLEEIRQEITNDPQTLLQYIQLSQMRSEEGKLLGYRVRPGKNKVLFESVGLENGDIATHINGEDLTDPATMARVWKSLSELTELNLTVDRKGQAEEIYIQF